MAELLPAGGLYGSWNLDATIEVLDRNGLTGVYAFSNSWALLRHPELVRVMDRWVNAGHHAANHTHNHPELNEVSAELYIEEIDLAERHLSPWLGAARSACFWRSKSSPERSRRSDYRRIAENQEEREAEGLVSDALKALRRRVGNGKF